MGNALPQRSNSLNIAWPNGQGLTAGSVISFVDPNAPSGSQGDFYIAVANVDAATTELPHSSSNFIRLGAFVDDTVATVQSLPEQVTFIRCTTGY